MNRPFSIDRFTASTINGVKLAELTDEQLSYYMVEIFDIMKYTTEDTVNGKMCDTLYTALLSEKASRNMTRHLI